jgi:metallo-beta-lactamase family protein
MRIRFLGAARTVTGSCYLVETKKSRFLVDCGMFQGNKKLKENNYASFGFEIKDIDFVLITHAHVDHCGLLPKLYKQGFTGRSYAS